MSETPIGNDANGSDDERDPFGDFINHELGLDSESAMPFGLPAHDELSPSATELEALRRKHIEHLHAQTHHLAQLPDIEAWEEFLDEDDLDIINAMADELPAALKARYSGKLTPDEWREVVRLVATMAFHIEQEPSSFVPTDLSVQRFLARSRARLAAQREMVQVTVKPDPRPKWQRWLPDILIFGLLGAALLAYALNGGHFSFTRMMDEVQATVAAQSAHVAELQLTLEALQASP